MGSLHGVSEPIARQLGMHLAALSQLSRRERSQISRQERSRFGVTSTRATFGDGGADDAFADADAVDLDDEESAASLFTHDGRQARTDQPTMIENERRVFMIPSLR
jgi:hypothetical protein